MTIANQHCLFTLLRSVMQFELMKDCQIEELNCRLQQFTEHNSTSDYPCTFDDYVNQGLVPLLQVCVCHIINTHFPQNFELKGNLYDCLCCLFNEADERKCILMSEKPTLSARLPLLGFSDFHSLDESFLDSPYVNIYDIMLEILSKKTKDNDDEQLLNPRALLQAAGINDTVSHFLCKFWDLHPNHHESLLKNCADLLQNTLSHTLPERSSFNGSRPGPTSTTPGEVNDCIDNRKTIVINCNDDMNSLNAVIRVLQNEDERGNYKLYYHGTNCMAADNILEGIDRKAERNNFNDFHLPYTEYFYLTSSVWYARNVAFHRNRDDDTCSVLVYKVSNAIRSNC
ncbi:hypothetical protein GEMRC1_011620 [Eukaryota sp. GEM-RC1]